MGNLATRPNARVYIESHGFVPLLIHFLDRRHEFSADETGGDSLPVPERENVTLVVLFFLLIIFFI